MTSSEFMEEGGIEPVQCNAWTKGICWEWNDYGDYEGDDNGDEYDDKGD